MLNVLEMLEVFEEIGKIMEKEMEAKHVPDEAISVGILLGMPALSLLNDHPQVRPPLGLSLQVGGCVAANGKPVVLACYHATTPWSEAHFFFGGLG